MNNQLDLQFQAPWDRPMIKNLTTVLNGTVVKVETNIKKVGGKDEEEDIPR